VSGVDGRLVNELAPSAGGHRLVKFDCYNSSPLLQYLCKWLCCFVLYVRRFSPDKTVLASADKREGSIFQGLLRIFYICKRTTERYQCFKSA